MRTKAINPRSDRRAAMTALMIGPLLLAGCGSSHSSSSPASPPANPLLAPHGKTISYTLQASGPRNLDANLTGLVAKNQPQLKNFKIICPRRPIYPVKCRFTATDTGHGAPHAVAGTETVNGVFVPTRTYVYGLDYRPK